MEGREVGDEKRKLVRPGWNFGTGGFACGYGSERSATPDGIAVAANDRAPGPTTTAATPAHPTASGAAVTGAGRGRARKADATASDRGRKIFGDASLGANRRAGDQVRGDRRELQHQGG